MFLHLILTLCRNSQRSKSPPNAPQFLIYRTFTSSTSSPSLSIPNPERRCYVQYRVKICCCPSSRKVGVGDRPIRPSSKLSSERRRLLFPPPFARRKSSIHDFQLYSALTPPQPLNYLSLNTFGFHPAFSSSSLLSASSAFLASLSIRSRALSTLLCR